MLVRTLALGLAVLAALGGRAEAGVSFPAVYAFGDSLSDAGNIYTATSGAQPVAPPYNYGRFSNGPVWIQDLAAAFGVYPLQPSLRGGTDFAYGGATSGASIVHPANATDLPAQFAQFALQVPQPRAGALYALWIGANDIFAILGTPGLSANQVAQAETQALGNISVFITGIAARGARDLVLVTVPDLGKTPSVTSEGAYVAGVATRLSADFNAKLVATAQALAVSLKIQLRIADSFALIDNAVADPAVYSLANVTAPCWTGTYRNRNGTLCSLTRAVQDTYLFWDAIHPTEHGQYLIAVAARNAFLKGSTQSPP